jgi:CHASE1-domain containing sensor protein
VRFFTKKFARLLAASLLFFAAIWYGCFSALILKIPSDFTYTADIASVDNFYDESNEAYMGPAYSVTQFSYQVLSSTDEGLVIQNVFNVKKPDGTPIFSTTRNYGIDPQTGAHVPTLGDKERSGYLFAPRNLKEGEGYTTWHVNYDGPAHMEYVDTEELNGLTVYHYQTHYEGVTIDQTKDLDRLGGVPEEKGVLVEPFLETWTEPLSGTLVKYQDDSIAYYYDIKTGERLSPWNHFQNSFTEDSVLQHINLAYEMKWKIILVEKIIPLSLILMAGLLLMASFWPENKKSNSKNGVSLAVTLFMTVGPLLGVIGSWFLLKASLEDQVRLHFEEQSQNIEDAIVRRLEIYINTLYGITGLFAASESVERDEWKTYIERLNLAKNYPGVSAVGFARVVKNADKESFLESVRSDGVPDYEIYPEGERADYAPILYVEKTDGTPATVLGYDLYMDAGRDQAMEEARDTGETALSGKLTPLDSTSTDPVFLIYLPIYEKNIPHETLEERRTAIYGYTYSPFLVKDLMDGTFGGTDLGVNFELYDGPLVEGKNLLYSSESSDLTTVISPLDLSKTETVYISGHPWTFQFTAQNEISLTGDQKLLLWGSLVLGLFACILWIFIYFSMLVSRQKMVEYLEHKRK